MPIVYVIGEDWTLRAGVRAELREHGIEALGMETAAAAGKALAAGDVPSVMVLDGNSRAASDSVIQALAGRIPSVVIASKSIAAPFPFASKTLFRPVQIREIVNAVLELLKGHAA